MPPQPSCQKSHEECHSLISAIQVKNPIHGGGTKLTTMALSGGGGTEFTEEEDILVLKLNHKSKREEAIRKSVRAEVNREYNARKLRKRPCESS